MLLWNNSYELISLTLLHHDELVANIGEGTCKLNWKMAEFIIQQGQAVMSFLDPVNWGVSRRMELQF